MSSKTICFVTTSNTLAIMSSSYSIVFWLSLCKRKFPSLQRWRCSMYNGTLAKLTHIFLEPCFLFNWFSFVVSLKKDLRISCLKEQWINYYSVRKLLFYQAEVLNGTIVNWALSSLHEGSPRIVSANAFQTKKYKMTTP